MKEKSLLKVISLYAIVSSLLLCFIIPPFQKTDEIDHYYKTIAVATGNFFCTNKGSKQFHNNLPKAYADLPEILFAEFTNQKTNKFPIASLKNALTIPDSSKSVWVEETQSCSLPFLLYVPVSLILVIPIKLHLSPLLVFYLGRVSFLLLAWLIIGVAYKICPQKYRLLLIGYLILPMVTIQLGSYNKEVFHLAAGGVAFASYFKLRKKFSKKVLMLLVVSLLLMVLARPFYAPLFILVPLSLPKKAFKYSLATGMILVAIFVSFLPKVFQFHSGVLDSTGISAQLQLEYLANHPIHFLSVLISSYNNHIGAYQKSLIGTYGYIHYYLDWYIYTFFGAWILYLCFHYYKQPPNLSKREIIGMSITLTTIVLSCFFLFYLYATPVAFHYVIDVQGRYFISLLPYTILLVALVLKRHLKFVVYTTLVIVIFFLLKNSYDRYYDYSQGYYSQNPELLSPLSQNQKIDSIEIAQPVTQLVAVDPDKKLLGFSLMVVNQNKKIASPLVLELYTPDCQQKISSTMVMNHLDSTSRYIDVRTKAVPNHSSQLCLIIKQFGQKPTNAINPQLATEPNTLTQRILLVPFYAF